MATNTSNPYDEPGDRHGYTYALTNSGDLRIDSLKRPTEIHDVDAVVQDLKVAMLTTRGEDPFRPEYGLDVFSAIGGNDARLRSTIVQTIGPDADPRVESIDDIEVDRTDGDRETTRVTVHLTLTEGPSITFDFSPLQGARSARSLTGGTSTSTSE